jgi:hypothetical protein
MLRLPLTLVLLLASSLALAAGLPSHDAPKDAKVYIISPANHAHVKSPVLVQFGLAGMGVAPAGVDKANTGHHHLLIDVDKLPAAGQPIPADKQHVHFGGGQTQVELNLTPGEHTLQLELGDMNHVPFNPPVVSQKITIHVE